MGLILILLSRKYSECSTSWDRAQIGLEILTSVDLLRIMYVSHIPGRVE